MTINQNVFENSYWILSHQVYVSNNNDECVVNASEATSRICSILGVFQEILAECTGGGHQYQSVISIKIHSSTLLESWFCVRCSSVSLLLVFGAPYHEMVCEGLLSIHHWLQIHCIVNVSICIKGLDDKIGDKTIVFCRSLQILT